MDGYTCCSCHLGDGRRGNRVRHAGTPCFTDRGYMIYIYTKFHRVSLELMYIRMARYIQQPQTVITVQHGELARYTLLAEGGEFSIGILVV